MYALLTSLAQYNALLLSAFGLAILGLGWAVTRQNARIAAMRARWRDLLEGVRGDDLERLLELHFRERQQILSELASLTSRLETLESKTRDAKCHLGLVRYDAFPDVTGAQSFALALYDDKGDGAVISSVIGRSDCRVYCKPLLSGRSERELSVEEKKAIESARGRAARSVG